MSHLELPARLRQTWSVESWRAHRICLAVSGGADSVALLRMFVAVGKRDHLLPQIIVGHVNHGLRGEESEEDARFVRDLSRESGLACEIRRLDADGIERLATQTGSREAAYRELRYDELKRIATGFGARYLVTAHTRNDQLETILYRLFRGSGISGLAGMSRIRRLDPALVLVRPLLDFTREELTDYLNGLGQNWREDSSNATNDYARNRIRHDLLPVLEELFPTRWEKSLIRLSGQAGEMNELLGSVCERYEASLRTEGETVLVDCDAFTGESSLVISDFFRRLWIEKNWPRQGMGAEQWLRLAGLVRTADETRTEFPGGLVAVTRRRTMTLFPKREKP